MFAHKHTEEKGMIEKQSRPRPLTRAGHAPSSPEQATPPPHQKATPLLPFLVGSPYL